MRFVTTIGIVFAGTLLSGVFARAQRNPRSPASLSTSEGSPIDQNAFDQLLQRILRESLSGFWRIEGSRIENRLREFYFEPKINLPGALYCRVLKHEGTTIYTCEWENGKVVNNWFAPLADAIERSLGPEWNKRQGSR